MLGGRLGLAPKFASEIRVKNICEKYNKFLPFEFSVNSSLREFCPNF